jgi:hypothetical protein
LDQAYFKLSLERTLKIGPAGADLAKAILGVKKPVTPRSLDKSIRALYVKTKFANGAFLKERFEKATLAELEKSKDPFAKLALRLAPLVKQAEEHHKRYDGAMLLVAPKYVAAMQQYKNKPIAPDANSSLRITFGTVKGYKPTEKGTEYKPFTTVTEMLAKVDLNHDKEPFEVPARVVEAAKAKNFGPYRAKEIGDLPVDFLADLDITGGNSGSAAINGKGELVGLAFDGVYEAIGSDWQFNAPVTRSIQVDLRYILWVTDKVDKAHPILSELGITPAAG